MWQLKQYSTATSASSYSEFVQSQFSMLSQALSQALPLHPHTCADLGYCSDTLVNVSCGLDLPVHGDEVLACNL